VPIGEEICGSCGAKQTPLVEVRRAEMAAAQAKAEGLLGDFRFDEASRIATTLREEPNARLSHLKQWAEGFLQEVEKSRSHQVEQVAASLGEAAKHEEAFDYLSAISTLESVPDAMRPVAIPSARETVAAVLDRLERKQAESRRLEILLKERITSKSVDGLLPEVERFLKLHPDRRDVQKLRQQLLDRQKRQEATRGEAVTTAKTLMARHEYEAAVAALANVSAAAMTPEVSSLRSDLEELVGRVRGLTETIRAAVAVKQLDGLLGLVDEYLKLKPGDAEISKLRQSIIAREEKLAAESAARRNQAASLFRSGQFAEAVKILEAISESRRTGWVGDLFVRCQRAAILRAGALQALSTAAAGRYAEAIAATTAYRKVLEEPGVADDEFTELLSNTEAAYANEERSRRLLRTGGLVAASAAALLTIVCGGLWIHSSQRAASVAEAVRTSRWEDALALAPDNADALVGRARAKLVATPADIDGAFADIERAEKGSPEQASVKATRGTAHAARAADHARSDHLAEAVQELEIAIGLDADPKSLVVTREAIATAWLVRAEEAAVKRDPTLMRIAIESAAKAGARAERLARLWRQYADSCAMRLDVNGLANACTEAESYGLAADEVANIWLRYGDEAANNRDVAAVQSACEAATKAGAASEVVSPLRTKEMILHALETFVQGAPEKAVGLAMEAISTNASAGCGMLKAPDLEGLRVKVVNEYRKRFNSFVGADAWKEAIASAKAAEQLDPQAGSWFRTVLTFAMLQRMPPAVISNLPPDALAAFSPEALVALSPARLVALPPLRNSADIELKLIPAGSFTMGQASSDNLERPHHVTLTMPFYLGVCEVTKAQWRRVMEKDLSQLEDGEQPVNNVSWEEAVVFCRKLTALSEERLARRVYRLPTEAEWEYACRAGTTTKYSFGDKESELGDYAYFEGNIRFVSNSGQACPVGQKKPNAWGLYDMHGNVREWCNDWFGLYPSGEVTDPTGDSLSPSKRIFRGGCFADNAWYCRTSVRGFAKPEEQSRFVGFRIALSLSGVNRSKAGK